MTVAVAGARLHTMLGFPAFDAPFGPAALRQELAKDIRFTRVPCPKVAPARRTAMLDLTRRTCPSLPSESYLADRLEQYDYVVLGESQGRLLAYQLVQEFMHGAERCIYLGPMFSREGACVPLFSALFDDVVKRSPGQAFHLLTEMQSPRAALLFKRVFMRSSYPRLADGWIPARARSVAAEFARKLPHIGPMDLENVSTRSTPTLYRESPEYAPVVEWMRRRGVALERGDAQVFVVTCEQSLVARAALRLEVWLGERALSTPRAEKRRMLQRFDRGGR